MDKQPTYEIPEANRDDFERTIARINRRAERLGCPAVQVREVSTRVVESRDGHVERFTTVAIDGEAPRLQGWSFIATIAHTSEVDLVHILPTAHEVLTVDQIEEYRARGPLCDHCQQNRRRNRTFLLQHESGEAITQVGSTCLQDFFNGVEASTLAGGAGLLVEAANAAEAAAVLQLDRVGPQLWSLRRFLAFSAAAIRRYGWVSKGVAADQRWQVATATRVRHALDAVEHGWFDQADEHETPNADDFVLADASIEWAQTLADETVTDDYLRNLGAVALAGCVEYRTAGLAASAVSAFQRARKHEWTEAERRVRKPSQYLNEVGQRCFWRARVEWVGEYPSDFGGMWAYFMLRDEAGSVIVWKSSRGAAATPEFTPGVLVEFKASVKKHEFNKKHQERQTFVTRVSDVTRLEG